MINNILKHAKAKEVVIELYRDEVIRLSVNDNGVGFDTKKKRKGIGIHNIQTRVGLYDGQINIHSEPGKGCQLRIEFPITNDILVKQEGG